MKKIFFIILLIALPHFALGQYIIANTYKNTNIDAAFIKDTLSIDADLKKAKRYSLLKENDARLLFNKAIATAYNLKSQEQIGKVLLARGIFYWENFEYFEAIKYFNKALPFFENIKNNKSLGKLNYHLAEAYYFVYSEDIAFKYFLRALNSYKKDKNEIGIAFCYNGIGTIYGSKNYKVGLNYLNKALTIFLKHKHYKGISSSYINLANITADNVDIPAGIDYYNKSLTILEDYKDDYNRAVNYNNLGDCYISLKEYDKALSHFGKALHISENMDVKVLHSLIYLNIADVKLKQGLFKESIKYANLSIAFAKKNADMEIQANNMLMLSSIYENMSDYKTALKYKNDYLDVKERAVKYENQKKIQLFQSISELEKSQFEINKLKIKNENTQLKLQSKMNWTYFLTFVSIILVSFVVILFYQQNAKKKIYGLLKIKSEQIMDLKDSVQIQNDYLNDLNNTKNKLFKIIAHDLKNPLSSIEAFTDMMLQKDDEYDQEDQVIFLNVIKESATKASEILNDVLVWAIDEEKPLVNKKLFIHKLVKEELKLLEIQALQKEIHIDNQVSGDLSVLTDKNKVATIIRNLIANAIKFSHPKGTILISGELGPKFIKITVKDHGIGIPTEAMGSLFIVDYKKSKLGTSHEEGTGLGLVLCKDFVEKLGGRITVSSVLNEGSAFSFTLPLTNLE